MAARKLWSLIRTIKVAGMSSETKGNQWAQFLEFCSNKPQHEQLHENSADKFPGQLLPVFFFLHRGCNPD